MARGAKYTVLIVIGLELYILYLTPSDLVVYSASRPPGSLQLCLSVRWNEKKVWKHPPETHVPPFGNGQFVMPVIL